MGEVALVKHKNPPGLVQVLWFVFIGWWAGEIWIVLSWLLMLTIIGIPLGVKMLNRLPKVIALRSQAEETTISIVDGVAVVSVGEARPQVNLLVRSLYFILIGWWFTGIWMQLAYLVALTLIGLPIAFWMFDRVPALLSLRR